MCDNKVSQWVASGYSHKEVVMQCGSTSVYGETLLCDECEAEVEAGKKARPGYCKHGVAISEYDCDCIRCELGD